MARPLKQLDEARIQLLASEGCTLEEISADIGADRDTIAKRYSADIKKGKDKAFISFRRKCLAAAFPENKREKPNVGFAVLFAKLMGWYVEKSETKTETKIELSEETMAKIETAAK